MAYIIREEEQLRISIFVILFPNECSFFVGKTLDGNLKQIYKQHYYGQIKKTKNQFLRAKTSGEVPPMHCVETVETSQEKAFLHCVAWTKYFLDHGYTSCCGEQLNQYANELREESRALYEAIKVKSLDDVCPEGKDLFPSYGRKKQKKSEADNTFIGFRVTPEEGLKIKNAATEAGITKSEYCKKMALNGRVHIVDKGIFESFTRCVNEFVARDALLKQLIAAIYSTKTYYPADLAIIQDALEDNTISQNEAFSEIKELLQQLLE